MNGNGIITGGALGVDYIATQLVLALGDPQTQLKIYLPIELEKFCAHYNQRTYEGMITPEQANIIVTQLKKVFTISPTSIKDITPYTKANVESYYARNMSIVKASDELYGFKVNNSQGVQDTINKAIELGKTVTVKEYFISI